MKKLIFDLKTLILGNWKATLILALVVYSFCYYPDIKQGINDG